MELLVTFKMSSFLPAELSVYLGSKKKRKTFDILGKRLIALRQIRRATRLTRACQLGAEARASRRLAYLCQRQLKLNYLVEIKHQKSLLVTEL